MKNTILILTTVMTFYACNANKGDEQNIQTINSKDIQIGEVIHDSLTTEQIDKIKIIQSTFEEVYPVSLEETITNFKRDQNPDKEIEVWLQMAEAYNGYLGSKKNNLDLNTKMEVNILILSRSMMPDEEAIDNAKLTILTVKEAKEVLSYYTLKPSPIDIEKNHEE